MRTELPLAVVDGTLDALVEIQRAKAALHAMELRLVDVLASPAVGDELATRETRAEIACALRMPERTAQALMDEAHVLVHELPAGLAALREGSITERHGKVLATELGGLTDDAERAVLEARALQEGHRSSGDFRRTVRRMLDRRAPESAARRHEKACRSQNVWVDPAADGMAYLVAYLPAPEAMAAFERVDDAARAVKIAEPEVGIGQARVGVLASMLLGTEPGGPRLGTVRTMAIVTIPASTLLGGDAMGELEGYGPIDAETARWLASEASVFRRMLTDPHTGIRLELGRESYRPSADQRLWLRLRDRRCRWPGCHRRVAASDLDHTIDWRYGGPTDAWNLAHLCRHHHRLKHESRWRVSTDADGTLIATSPCGRRYESPIPTDPDPPWVVDLPLRDAG